MKKTWIAPKAEELNINATESGWNALKIDWSFDGLPLIGEDGPKKPGCGKDS